MGRGSLAYENGKAVLIIDPVLYFETSQSRPGFSEVRNCSNTAWSCDEKNDRAVDSSCTLITISFLLSSVDLNCNVISFSTSHRQINTPWKILASEMVDTYCCQ